MGYLLMLKYSFPNVLKDTQNIPKQLCKLALFQAKPVELSVVAVISGKVDFQAGVSVSHLLFGLYYFGFQVSRDDSPSGKQRAAINQAHSGCVSQRDVCRLTIKIENLSSVSSRMRFSVPKPRAALAFLME